MLRKAIFLMGPTASGKTGLAITLRERFGMEIISVDSAQVYRGLDIGAAKPDAATLAAAPHALIDIRDPEQAYSAAEFREDALAEMQAIDSRGNIPLLAGGTMLYFRALEHGLAEMPAADPAVRAELEAQAKAFGWAVLHQRLAELDPQAAQRIHPNDPQRIQRALEVIRITGRPMTEFHQQQASQALDWDLLKIVVCPQPRSVLHQRIEQRFDEMLDAGFLDEVRALREREELSAELPSMRSVGYRQAWAHLDGEYDAQEMREKALAATRQLAKRQLTWLRNDSGAIWYDLTEDSALESVVTEVEQFLE